MDLKAFGKKLKALRTTAGLSQAGLVDQLNEIHVSSNPGDLGISSNLISKWETAYSYQGRQWVPSRQYAHLLIEVFVRYLNVVEAITWAGQAGHIFVEADLEDLFPSDWDGPLQTPQLPIRHVRRQQLEAEIRQQLGRGTGQSLVLWGSGGAGKTTLATWICTLLAAEFPDGIIWISVESGDTVIDIQNEVAEHLGLPLPEGSASTAKRARRLHSRLRKKRCLVVLDDISALRNLADLRLGSNTSRLLCTTRDFKVIEVLEAAAIKVTGLTEAEGVEMLSHWTDDKPKAGELVARLGGLPLALKLVNGHLRSGLALADLLAAFQAEQVDLSILDMDDPQTRGESLSLCFDLSYQHLPQVIRHRFAQLGYFRSRRFDEAALQGVWGMTPAETRATIRRLLRYALLDQYEQGYQLHPLLHDFVRQRLAGRVGQDGAILNDEAIHRRHATWYIRYVLAHPGLIAGKMIPAPALDHRWADVTAGVQWATEHDPTLATQAALLAYADRPALLEEIGPTLISAIESYLSSVTAEAEQAMLHELLADLYILTNNIANGLQHFEQAGELWQTIGEIFADSRVMLRMAGVHLMAENLQAAAATARQAQALLADQMSIISSPVQLAQAESLFYWFNMVYNPLVRWEGLPEADLVTLTDWAKRSEAPSLIARSLHLHRLWCTTKAIERSDEVRQRGRRLALAAYEQWQACGRKDRADDEVSMTIYYLTNRYSWRTARRFARRRLKSTPTITELQSQLRQKEGVGWWLSADETQRVAWLSRMLPRFMRADNRPYQPATGHQLSILEPDSLAYRSVENILSLSALGQEARRLMLNNSLPPNHFLSGPEWQVLQGQQVLPLLEPQAKAIIAGYTEALT